MNRSIEFLIKGIVEGQPGRLRVIGRCTEDTIQRADLFTCTFQYVDSADARQGVARTGIRPLQLKVIGLHAYGRELDQLGPGMTGTIDLDGTGFELVVPGSLLGVSDAADQIVNQPLEQDPAAQLDVRTSA
jgi:hypothetical protein